MEKDNNNDIPVSVGKDVVLVIDNYDSFTYNLVHLINEVGYEAVVWRNDKFDLAEVDQFNKILLSPGPGIPEEAGLLLDVIKTYAPTKSIFGVCLGQQAIAEVFGGTLLNLGRPMHGVATPITVVDGNEPLFWECPQTINVGRYHSWVVSKENFPSCLKITARDHKNEIMALRHESFDVRGVQFHPESILTEFGKQMMENWLTSTS